MQDSDVDREAAAKPVVLIVDDDPLIRKVLSRQLGQLGVDQVSTADNGASALRCLRSESPPELILCDLQMPTMSGIEFLRQLHFESYSGGIVLISGEAARTRASATELLRAYGLHALGSLGKPVELAALADVVARWADKPRPERACPPVVASADPAETSRILNQPLPGVVFEPLFRLGDNGATGAVARPGLKGVDPAPYVAGGAILDARHSATLADDLLKRFYPTAFAAAAPVLQQQPGWRLMLELPLHLLSQQADVDDLLARAQNSDLALNQMQFLLLGDVEPEQLEQTLHTTGQLVLNGASLWAGGQDRSLRQLEGLLRLPLAGLCIDPELVQRATRHPAAGELVKAFIALGHALELAVASLDIKDQAAFELCRAGGCDLASGPYIAPALSTGSFTAWAGWQAAHG